MYKILIILTIFLAGCSSLNQHDQSDSVKSSINTNLDDRLKKELIVYLQCTKDEIDKEGTDFDITIAECLDVKNALVDMIYYSCYEENKQDFLLDIDELDIDNKTLLRQKIDNSNEKMHIIIKQCVIHKLEKENLKDLYNDLEKINNKNK